MNKVEFKNGSEINPVETNNSSRGKRAKISFYHDPFEKLKWHHKLYLRWLLFFRVGGK